MQWFIVRRTRVAVGPEQAVIGDVFGERIKTEPHITSSAVAEGRWLLKSNPMKLWLSLQWIMAVFKEGDRKGTFEVRPGP
jgi:hypothetical protein